MKQRIDAPTQITNKVVFCKLVIAQQFSFELLLVSLCCWKGLRKLRTDDGIHEDEPEAELSDVEDWNARRDWRNSCSALLLLLEVFDEKKDIFSNSLVN